MYIPRPITQDALLSLIPPAASSPQQPPIRAQKLWFFHTVKLSYSCLSLCQNASDGGWLPSSSELWITFACSNWFCPCYFHSCCGHSTKSYLHCALHGLNLQPGVVPTRYACCLSSLRHSTWAELCSICVVPWLLFSVWYVGFVMGLYFIGILVWIGLFLFTFFCCLVSFVCVCRGVKKCYLS